MSTAEALPGRVTRLVEEATAWIGRNAGDILLALLAAAFVSALLLGLRALGIRLCRNERQGVLRLLIGRLLSATRLWFVVATAIEIVANVGNAPPMLSTAGRLLFTIAASFQAAIWLRELIIGWIDHRTVDQGDPHGSFASAMGIIQLLVSFTLFAIATLFVLDNIGINVGTLVAGLGIGGIAIGLAAQGIFKDLFAALSILFDRPFRRGDQIEYGALGGRVEAIGLKSTKLRAVGGERLIVSNARLLDQDIRNISEMTSQRVTLKLGLLYTNPPALLRRVPALLEEIVGTIDMTRFGHGAIVGLGDNAIELELMFHVLSSDRDRMRRARHEAALRILERFRELGIGLFPATPVEPPVADAGPTMDKAGSEA